MDFASVGVNGPPAAVLAFAFLFCMASAVVPVLNSEAYLLLLSAAAPRHLLLPAVLLATTGHMIGKSIMFFTGSGLKRLSGERVRRKLAEVTARLERWRRTNALFIFGSGALGIPPFYLVAVAAGALRLSFPAFFVAGFLGRLVRFTAVAGIPQLIREVV